MYLYAIFGILFLFSMFEMNLGKNFGKKIMGVCMIVFFLMATLRWERGTDWNAYVFVFENMKDNFYLQATYEFLFKKLNELVKAFTDNYTIMLGAQALIIYIIYYYVIRKYAVAPVFSVFIWFSFSFASIFFTRQAIAGALVFLSFDFIARRKLIFFLVCVFIATQFHRTALIFVPAYWIYKLNLSRLQIIIILVGSFLLTTVATSLLTVLAGSGFGAFSEKTTIYLDGGTSADFGSAYTPMQTMLRGLTYRIAIIAVLLFFFFKYYQQSVDFRGIMNLYIFGVVTFIVFVPISTALIRFAFYFEIFQIFLFPYLVYFSQNKLKRNGIILLISVYSLTRLMSSITAYEDLYIPYKSIFNKELPVEVY